MTLWFSNENTKFHIREFPDSPELWWNTPTSSQEVSRRAVQPRLG